MEELLSADEQATGACVRVRGFDHRLKGKHKGRFWCQFRERLEARSVIGWLVQAAVLGAAHAVARSVP